MSTELEMLILSEGITRISEVAYKKCQAILEEEVERIKNICIILHSKYGIVHGSTLLKFISLNNPIRNLSLTTHQFTPRNELMHYLINSDKLICDCTNFIHPTMAGSASNVFQQYIEEKIKKILQTSRILSGDTFKVSSYMIQRLKPRKLNMKFSDSRHVIKMLLAIEGYCELTEECLTHLHNIFSLLRETFFLKIKELMKKLGVDKCDETIVSLASTLLYFGELRDLEVFSESCDLFETDIEFLGNSQFMIISHVENTILKIVSEIRGTFDSLSLNRAFKKTGICDIISYCIPASSEKFYNEEIDVHQFKYSEHEGVEKRQYNGKHLKPIKYKLSDEAEYEFSERDNVDVQLVSIMIEQKTKSIMCDDVGISSKEFDRAVTTYVSEYYDVIQSLK